MLKMDTCYKVEENPDYPKKVFPPVRACEKARAAVEWFYHPDRLKFPLKRAGDRGEGKWEQTSWDQALDEIAHKLGEIKEDTNSNLGEINNHLKKLLKPEDKKKI